MPFSTHLVYCVLWTGHHGQQAHRRVSCQMVFHMPRLWQNHSAMSDELEGMGQKDLCAGTTRGRRAPGPRNSCTRSSNSVSLPSGCWISISAGLRFIHHRHQRHGGLPCFTLSQSQTRPRPQSQRHTNRLAGLIPAHVALWNPVQAWSLQQECLVDWHRTETFTDQPPQAGWVLI